MRNKKSLLIWIALSLSLFFWIFIISNISDEFLDLGGDSAQYIILAESIAQGHGYKAVNYPYSPPSNLPPLFPLILTLIISIFGRDFFVMHLLVAVMAYFVLFFFYRIFEKEARSKIAIFTIILLALSRLFSSYTFRILTEIPFLFLCGFTLYFLDKYKYSEKIFSKEGIFSALGLILTYLCRYIGITLFFAALLDFILHKDYRKIQIKKITFLTFALLFVIVIWSIRNFALGSSYVTSVLLNQFLYIDSYRPYLGLITQKPLLLFYRTINNLIFYFSIAGETLFSTFIRESFTTVLQTYIYLFGAIFILIGIILDFRKKKYILAIFFVLYFLFLLIWPFHEDGRYFLPLLPLTVFYFLVTFDKFLGLFKKSKYLFYETMIILIILNLVSLPVKRQSFQMSPYYLRNFITLNRWIAKNLPPTGVIFSRKPTVTYFFTHHKSIVYPFTLNPGKIWQEAKKYNVKYIIVDEFSPQTYRYLGPFLYKYRNKLKLLHRIGNSGVFEILK